jgi:hypothetical protein
MLGGGVSGQTGIIRLPGSRHGRQAGACQLCHGPACPPAEDRGHDGLDRASPSARLPRALRLAPGPARRIRGVVPPSSPPILSIFPLQSRFPHREPSTACLTRRKWLIRRKAAALAARILRAGRILRGAGERVHQREPRDHGTRGPHAAPAHRTGSRHPDPGDGAGEPRGTRGPGKAVPGENGAVPARGGTVSHPLVAGTPRETRSAGVCPVCRVRERGSRPGNPGARRESPATPVSRGSGVSRRYDPVCRRTCGRRSARAGRGSRPAPRTWRRRR